MLKHMRLRRRIIFERLEPRYAMDGDCTDGVGPCPTEVDPTRSAWQNAFLPADVNQDGLVSPLDALIVINELTENGARPLGAGVPPQNMVDVNGDRLVTPLDALVVIDELNRVGPIRSDIEHPPAASAFDFDTANRVISMDTRIAPAQRRRFDIGFGSVTLETLRLVNGELTFRYTPEIEGGYTIYECSVAVSPEPVRIQVTAGGLPGTTSFDLADCLVIGRGNVFWD